MQRRVCLSLARTLACSEKPAAAIVSKAFILPRIISCASFHALQPPSVDIFAGRARCYSTVQKMGQVKPPKRTTKAQVKERVIKAVKAWDRFPSDRLDKLALDSRFVEDLGFDSLDHVEIVMSIEDEFGFEIPDTEAEKFKTPNDVVTYVCKEEDVYE